MAPGPAPHSPVAVGSSLGREGQVTFQVEGAFYRPKSAIARDLAILVATLYKRQQGQLRVLDAMTGCGVRPLRYLREAEADWVWANEGNPDLATTLEANLSQADPARYRLTYGDAQSVFFACYQHRDFYDLVDIDNFGGPAPHTSNGLWAAKIGGLLYLTSTDGRSTSGHDPERSLKVYGASARSHPAVHEQGLRLLIGHAAQTAAARGLGIQPVFSLFTGQVHRVMVRLVSKPTLSSQTYGFLAYCHRCGHFQTVDWRKLGRVRCPICRDLSLSQPSMPPDLTLPQDSKPTQDSASDVGPVLSGPLWLGALHEVSTLQAMQSLAMDWGWSRQGRLLSTMMAEAALPPYYYPLGELGRRGQMDIPNRDRLIAALRAQGYWATVPHCHPQAVKTNAAFGDCLAIARQI